MLRARLITAAVAIPILIWVIFRAPLWVFDLVVLIATFVALREFAAMAVEGFPHGTTMVILGGMLIATTMGIGKSPWAASAATVVTLAGVLVGTLAGSRRSNGTSGSSSSNAQSGEMEMRVNMAGQVLLGCLYGGLLIPHFIWVRGLPDGSGPNWVFFVFACVMAGDAGGYFGGRAFGRRPLWPQISPKKTVEGALCSFAGSLLIGLGADALVTRFLSTGETIAIAGVINVLAQLGDLLESMLKRAYQAHDSGWILPGHGGVLDRTDSLVLPIVFVYYYAILAS